MKIYITEPPWYKWVDLILWTLVYVFAFAYGIFQIVYPPSTVVGVTGALLLQITGGTVSAASLVALVGVISRKIVFEASSVWFVVAGMTAYPAAIWSLAFGPVGFAALSPAALLLTITIFLFTGWALRLTAARRNEVVLMLAEKEALQGVDAITEKS